MRKIILALFMLIIYAVPCSAENVYLSEDDNNIYYLDTNSIIFAGNPILTLPSEPKLAKIGVLIYSNNPYNYNPQTVDEFLNPDAYSSNYANMLINTNTNKIVPEHKIDKDILSDAMSIQLYKVEKVSSGTTETFTEGPKTRNGDGSKSQDLTKSDPVPVIIFDISTIKYSPEGVRLMANWYLTIKDYIDTHNWAITERTKKMSDNLITLSDVAPSTVPQSVDNSTKPIKYQQLEWTLYKTINLTPGKPVKVNIPAAQWQISPSGSFIQFTIEGEDGLYFNENGISGNTISGCGAGDYVIKSESSGSIKITIQK